LIDVDGSRGLGMVVEYRLDMAFERRREADVKLT
jgi:hypothetical protein